MVDNTHTDLIVTRCPQRDENGIQLMGLALTKEICKDKINQCTQLKHSIVQHHRDHTYRYICHRVLAKRWQPSWADVQIYNVDLLPLIKHQNTTLI